MVALTKSFTNPLQYSCLENPIDWAAWQAEAHRISRCERRLKRRSTYVRMHAQHRFSKTNLHHTAKQLFPENSPAVGAVGSDTRSMLLTSVLVLDLRSGSEVKLLSRVWPCVTPRTVAYQPPPSMGFSRQEHWSGLPFPSPGDLPDPRDRTQLCCIPGRCFNLRVNIKHEKSWPVSKKSLFQNQLLL